MWLTGRLLRRHYPVMFRASRRAAPGRSPIVRLLCRGATDIAIDAALFAIAYRPLLEAGIVFSREGNRVACQEPPFWIVLGEGRLKHLTNASWVGITNDAVSEDERFRSAPLEVDVPRRFASLKEIVPAARGAGGEINSTVPKQVS